MDEDKIIETEFEEPTEKEQTTEPAPKKEPKETKKDESEKKYSDTDLDEIISKKFAKWTAQKEIELSEAQKLAEMDAQQKAEYERDQLQNKLAELEKQSALNQMGKTARSILSEKGISVPDELISVLVTEEAESTKKNVDAFANVFAVAVESAVNEKLKSGTPKRMAGSKAMTRDEILNIADAKARRKAIQENLELFN